MISCPLFRTLMFWIVFFFSVSIAGMNEIYNLKLSYTTLSIGLIVLVLSLNHSMKDLYWAYTCVVRQKETTMTKKIEPKTSFRDEVALKAYGKTKDETGDLCIDCGREPDFSKGGMHRDSSREYLANAREFRISKLCPFCFDGLFEEKVWPSNTTKPKSTL